MQLRIPGPTPCPPEVLQAMSKQMINHRGKEFEGILNSITTGLQQVFQTKGDVLTLTTSGTGGLEAAIVNTLSPGDKVLAVSIGVFGDRFVDIAKQFGVTVKYLGFEWGKAADPQAIHNALEADPQIKAVLITHNETSTGVTNNLKEIAPIVKGLEKLLIVDAVSSMGCIDLPVDDLRCDVVVTASQKGWMVPPGLAMVSMSDEAWKAHAHASIPRYYMDFTKAKDFLVKRGGQTPWTPVVSVCYALDVALGLMLHDGLANIFNRHARLAQMMRVGVKSLGLSLFADENYSSNTVTAVKADKKFNAAKLVQVLRDEYGVTIAGGQGKLKGEIIRVAHLGWVTDKDIEAVLQALAKALPRSLA